MLIWISFMMLVLFDDAGILPLAHKKKPTIVRALC